MLLQERNLREINAKLDDGQKQRIKDYIQGSVYCFCKNCPDQWFAARDLFGRENYYWQNTPLMELFNWHRKNESNDPVKMAGRDMGWLLLAVLKEDKREFEYRAGYTNEYKWTGKEDNSIDN